jgi:hypothetical protein
VTGGHSRGRILAPMKPEKDQRQATSGGQCEDNGRGFHDAPPIGSKL